MDSDCLIKIIKAGLKERVTRHFKVLIPGAIEKEVVQAGIAKGLADAEVARENIASGKLAIFGAADLLEGGDESLIRLFPSARCDAVATDDARLVKRLRAHGIPFILPGLILFKLVQARRLDAKEAVRYLDRLADYISPDEYATVRLLLEKRS